MTNSKILSQYFAVWFVESHKSLFNTRIRTAGSRHCTALLRMLKWLVDPE